MTGVARRPPRGRPAAWLGRAAEPWASAARRRLRVAELFASIQGEGTRAGLPTVFVRFTGCALRCSWCDTAWAFREGTWRKAGEIAREVEASGLAHVCLTGGEPLLQPGVVPLARHLAEDLGLDVVVETGGDQDISVLPPSVVRILDVKLPSSGMHERMDPENLRRLSERDEVKFVIADRADYEAARRILRRDLASFRGAVLFAPAHGLCAPERLAEWMLEDRLPARLQIQIHKAIWPGRDRGI